MIGLIRTGKRPRGYAEWGMEQSFSPLEAVDDLQVVDEDSAAVLLAGSPRSEEVQKSGVIGHWYFAA